MFLGTFLYCNTMNVLKFTRIKLQFLKITLLFRENFVYDVRSK